MNKKDVCNQENKLFYHSRIPIIFEDRTTVVKSKLLFTVKKL